MAVKNLRGGVKTASKNLREGVNKVDEDEKVVQVLRIREKPQEMILLELPPGHAEPGLIPDRRVQSVLKGQQVQAIIPADRLHQ